MLLEVLLTILRSVLYLWIAIEFLLLANLYIYGYKKYKPTKIILALQRIFFFGGLLFLFLTFIPILLISNTDAFDVTILLVPIVLIPLIYFLRMFREKSLDEKEVKLPENKKDK